MSAPPITAATGVAAVIGAPVEHSLSPNLHNAALAGAGIDAVYLALHVAPDQLAAAMAGFRALGFLGLSVTVPHKQAIIPLCDRLAAPADRIGAVNCVVFERSATGCVAVGHNTDAGGFVDALTDDAAGGAMDRAADLAGSRVVLLGAGGAARAVHAGLDDAGAGSIEVITRTPARVDWVAARPWTEDELARLCRDCDLLVDCTSTALSAEREAQVPTAVPVDLLPDRAVVASLVYHRRPALLTAAAERGLRTIDGAGMLVHQGVRAFELWTGVSAPVSKMWAAMRAAMVEPKHV
ncbi:MAG: shikimate dehydrogenase [Myxococcota bacterium]